MAASSISSTSPPRLVRVNDIASLNTIMEDTREDEHQYPSSRSADTFPPHTPTMKRTTNPRASLASESTSFATSTGYSTRRPDFDDLYDASGESDDDAASSCPSLSSGQDGSRSSGTFTLPSSNRSSSSTTTSSNGRRNAYPVLFIPSSNYASVKNSPVPPTPPPKIPLSPLALSRLPRMVPALGAPPSLAGSTSAASERPSTLSTPQTPDLAAVPDVNWDEQQLRVEDELELDDRQPRSAGPSTVSMSPQVDIQLENPEDWSVILGSFPGIPARAAVRSVGDDESEPTGVSERGPPSSVQSSSRGVRLSDTALHTLQHMRVGNSSYSSLSTSEAGETGEMQLRPNSTGDLPLEYAESISGSSFTSLSLPSPGGFFASLKGQARRTWSLPVAHPPTSAVAERFYNLPWTPEDDNIVEQVLDVADDDDATEGPPTAKAVVPSAPSTARRIPSEFLERDEVSELKVDDVVDEYDEAYVQGLKAHSMANIDRTNLWLSAQPDFGSDQATRAKPAAIETPGKDLIPTKKAVRFLETVPEDSDSLKSPPVPKDSIFYHGFQHVKRYSRSTDTFLHSNFRFEAIQAIRLSMMDKHIDHLSGKYERTNPIRPPYRGPFSQAPRNSKLPGILAEQAMFAQVEKEQDILIQLHSSIWAIEALKFLHGGSLVPSPAAKRLDRTLPTTPKTSPRRRIRVLDLGGHTACDWAWYLANQYPNISVYTAITENQIVNPLKGPSNHRLVTASELWNLPFPDNHFDMISARSLHMLLKSDRPHGTDVNEFDLCLREAYRCLKPGGYLEFMLFDAEIARAGPYGSATSVEFAFNLKTRGYEPCPTRMFLSRVRRAGFLGIKRAWLFLPMGTPGGETGQVPGSSNPAETEAGAEAQVIGSTADVASTTGLLGGWMWEQWMLKLQMETGRERGKLLEETAGVIEEGRKCGAGWRCLSGWAMKPKMRRFRERTV